MMKKVFIDGSAGTTGLRIKERLSKRSDIELIILPEELRKDSEARKKALNECDIAFLCLPDAAAIEAVNMIENENVVVLDTSTAHRTDEGWAYGFPELSKEHFEKVATSKRIAVPGCHASGFIALTYPLVEKGIINKETLLSCHSITGYSGGGKKMIAEYEDSERDTLFDAPRQYALGQTHKHLPEMTKVTGLENAPVFCPIVSDFYSGMVVTVPIFKSQLNSGFTAEDIKNAYKEKYTGEIVTYSESISESGLISGNALSFKDSMQITVEGNDERILLIARYDNLGKGASGAALECMNISMGASPSEMLDI
ncbi:MAG: N-acetyl-gamma-glutamyl-phosphate reductase [Clostridia bacterium]|nr:N-acetyl-gamma-glutamyl-phosphate reductase [Clostridia bacterium]